MVRGNQARLKIVDHDREASEGAANLLPGRKLRPTGTAGDTTGAV
jgi:hypothetical protein